MSGRVFSLKEKGANCPERWQGPWRESSERGITVTLTKAFLNCNELPKSELCLLSSGIESPRLEERKPTPSPSVLSSYKGPREPRVYVHACIHIRAAHPPHVMNIFTLIAGLGDFSSAPVSADPSIEDTLFISTGRVRLVPNPLDIHTFRREHDPSLGDGLMISLNWNWRRKNAHSINLMIFKGF